MPNGAPEDWFDDDIAEMDLGYGEKAGLQIYRNYGKSFEAHARKAFVEALDTEQIDLGELKKLASKIVAEDARFLPVIACAFADQQLEAAFKAALPEGIPGGKASLFRGYGPLSSLAQRIQLAYAFNILSPDLMKDLDHLRATRNAISHSWDVSNLDGFLVDGRLGEMVRVDGILAERSAADEQLVRGLDAIGGFRVSLIWIMSRLVYEAAAYHRAKAANLHPQHALYDDPPPKWLRLVGEVALDASRQIANNG